MLLLIAFDIYVLIGMTIATAGLYAGLTDEDGYVHEYLSKLGPISLFAAYVAAILIWLPYVVTHWKQIASI